MTEAFPVFCQVERKHTCKHEQIIEGTWLDLESPDSCIHTVLPSLRASSFCSPELYGERSFVDQYTMLEGTNVTRNATRISKTVQSVEKGFAYLTCTIPLLVPVKPLQGRTSCCATLVLCICDEFCEDKEAECDCSVKVTGYAGTMKACVQSESRVEGERSQQDERVLSVITNRTIAASNERISSP